MDRVAGLLSDRVDLLSLELQRAGRALVQIVALVVVCAILAVTAWLALGRVHKPLPLLRLPATRRHLMISPSAQPSAGQAGVGVPDPAPANPP